MLYISMRHLTEKKQKQEKSPCWWSPEKTTGHNKASSHILNAEHVFGFTKLIRGV